MKRIKWFFLRPVRAFCHIGSGLRLLSAWNWFASQSGLTWPGPSWTGNTQRCWRSSYDELHLPF